MITEKAEPQPHACSKGNFEIARKLVSLYTWPAKMAPGIWEFKIHDYDPLTDQLKTLKYIGFYGAHEGKKYGYPVSFHQHTLEFEKELGETLRNIEECGYISRRDRAIERPLTPLEKHRKISYAYARKYPQAADPFRCILAHQHHVEVRNNMKIWNIDYDISDSEWKEKTGWE